MSNKKLMVPLGLLFVFFISGWLSTAFAAAIPTPPSALFTATPGTAVTKQIVVFKSPKTGAPISWAWNFGDGTTSTLQDPSHAFGAAGSYVVTLKVSNGKLSSTASKKILVSTPPAPVSADFSCSPNSPITNQSVKCTGTVTGNTKAISWAWSFGDGARSATQTPSHTYVKSGTFTLTLMVTVNGKIITVSHNLTVADSSTLPASQSFNLTQTLSDGAQRTTLAFAGLAMMTGNLPAQSFFPPGKVADYTGFQYLRDNDPDHMGHNTSFLTRVANNVIYLLDDNQFAQLKALATTQLDEINLYGYRRFPLMKAFRRVIDNDIPTGSLGLNVNAVKRASRELYMLDGTISFERALLYANLLSSMSTSQKTYLDAMKGKGWKSWPDISNDQIKTKMQGLPQGTAVAVMTYAGDLFSWYAGSLDADVYFCPERHGTYFGSFYIKDAPAIGHEGYAINEQLTATAGAALSDSSKGYVTQAQANTMSGLVLTQKDNLYSGAAANIVGTRTAIAKLLRSLLITTVSADDIKAQVLDLSAIYGELDGENNYNYATVFAQVYQTLSTEQKAKLTSLRQSIMSGTYSDGTSFDFSVTNTPFLYSQVISDVSLIAPYVDNTDALFYEP